MPPAALWLMVVERASLAALRTGPLHTGFMLQMNVNFPITRLQLNAVHSPRGLKSGHTVRDPALVHYELTHSNPGCAKKRNPRSVTFMSHARVPCRIAANQIF